MTKMEHKVGGDSETMDWNYGLDLGRILITVKKIHWINGNISEKCLIGSNSQKSIFNLKFLTKMISK